MSVLVFVAALALFVAALAVHVALWRWRRPRADIPAVFGVFLGLPVLAAAVAVPAGLVPGDLLGTDGAAALLLYLVMAGGYVMSYPAAQAQSPSLKLLMLVTRAMPAGIARADLFAAWGDDEAVGARVDDLVDNGLARVEDGVLSATPAGRRMAGVFLALRRFYGREGKGG